MKIRVAFLVGALFSCGSAQAGEDHERALRAVEEGRVLPLREILAKVERNYPGQLIEAELEGDDKLPIYDIKLLGNDGRVVRLLYDARSGEPLPDHHRENRR